MPPKAHSPYLPLLPNTYALTPTPYFLTTTSLSPSFPFLPLLLP